MKEEKERRARKKKTIRKIRTISDDSWITRNENGSREGGRGREEVEEDDEDEDEE